MWNDSIVIISIWTLLWHILLWHLKLLWIVMFCENPKARGLYPEVFLWSSDTEWRVIDRMDSCHLLLWTESVNFKAKRSILKSKWGTERQDICSQHINLHLFLSFTMWPYRRSPICWGQRSTQRHKHSPNTNQMLLTYTDRSTETHLNEGTEEPELLQGI